MGSVSLVSSARLAIDQLGLKPQGYDRVTKCILDYAVPKTWGEYLLYLASKTSNFFLGFISCSTWDYAKSALIDQLTEIAYTHFELECQKMGSPLDDAKVKQLKQKVFKGFDKAKETILATFLATCIKIQENNTPVTPPFKERCAELNYIPAIKSIISRSLAKYAKKA